MKNETSINHDPVRGRACETSFLNRRGPFLVPLVPHLFPVLLLILPLCGCGTTKPAEPGRRGPVPTYSQLARRYNKRLVRLDRLRVASFPIVYTWRDEEGSKQTERCSGELALIVPDRLMLRVKYITKGTFMWAGSNQTHYWFFDLHEKEDKKAYFGRHAEFGKGRSLDLQLPLHPREVAWLLGIVPLKEETGMPPPSVRWEKELLVVDAPGAPMRLWIDPLTYQPARVDVVDEAGGSRVSSALSVPRLVRLEKSPAWPRMATRIIITRSQDDQELRLTLPSEGMYDYPVHPKWFDLDNLIQMVPDEPGRRIDLDKEEKQP